MDRIQPSERLMQMLGQVNGVLPLGIEARIGHHNFGLLRSDRRFPFIEIHKQGHWLERVIGIKGVVGKIYVHYGDNWEENGKASFTFDTDYLSSDKKNELYGIVKMAGYYLLM